MIIDIEIVIMVKKPVTGFEPVTSCLLGKCSTTKLYRLFVYPPLP